MFCTLEVEEEREEAEGNPNGVVYAVAVAVKTAVQIIVGNLLRQIQQPVLCFCAGAVRLCARSQAAGER